MLLAGLLASACVTPLEAGERYYREGDRLAALESWQKVRDYSSDYEKAQARISAVEQEFEQLVVLYQKRARYYEDKGRLAESVLNYRLALKLRPDDRETLDHVQSLARVLAQRRGELRGAYRERFEAGELGAARERLAALRTLDPLSPEVAGDRRQLNQALRAEVDRRLARGRRGFSSGNYASAELAFREVLALEPENESAQGYLSFIVRNREEEGEAGSRDASGVNATVAEIRAEGFYQNALAAEGSEHLFHAIESYLRALRANNHPRATRKLASLRERMTPQVEELIESGRAYYQEEELQDALDQWGRALLIDPGNDQAKEYVARAERLIENLERLRANADGTS